MSIAVIRTRAHTLRCVLAAIPLALALALALPATAGAASDPGINYDPGSPAGKEYAIPLVQGRADGAGTQNQQAAANTAFGVGITPPGGGGPGSGGKRAAGHGKSPAGASDTGSSTGSSGGSSASRPADRRLSPALAARVLKASEPQGTGLPTAGVVLAVLLASAALALALRRRPEQRSR